LTRTPILKAGESYSFSNFFELSFDPEDILTELGYGLARSPLTFPPAALPFDPHPLQQTIRVLEVLLITLPFMRECFSQRNNPNSLVIRLCIHFKALPPHKSLAQLGGGSSPWIFSLVQGSFEISWLKR
jgi:hypothetical protein